MHFSRFLILAVSPIPQFADWIVAFTYVKSVSLRPDDRRGPSATGGRLPGQTIFLRVSTLVSQLNDLFLCFLNAR